MRGNDIIDLQAASHENKLATEGISRKDMYAR